MGSPFFMNQYARINLKSRIWNSISKQCGLFVMGFLAGIILLAVQKEEWLIDTGFLSEYALGPVKYMDIDHGLFFLYVCRQRIGTAIIILVLSTTYLGLIVNGLFFLWSGFTAGLFVYGAFFRYEWKGILLILGCVVPQQLVLVPGYLLLSIECMKICRKICFRELFMMKIPAFILRMILIFIVIFAGVILECYVNPEIMQMFLKFL